MEHDWDWNMINYQEQSNIEVLSVQETKPDFSCVYIFSPCGSHRISRPPLCHRVMEIDIYKSRDCIWIMQQSNQTKM